MSKKAIEELTMAMARLLCMYPPEKFNVDYFSILIMSGRIEEVTDYVTDFTNAEE